MFTTEQGELELASRLPEVLKELKTRVIHLIEMGLLLLPLQECSQLEKSLLSIEKSLVELTVGLAGQSLKTKQSPLSRLRADYRLSKAISPAKRGSLNLGDCLIVEHFLEVVRELRLSGFDRQCVFISSNFKDFGKAPNPKPPLDTEFAALSMDYMPDFAAALDQIGI